jgi:hypothetical protein
MFKFIQKLWGSWTEYTAGRLKTSTPVVSGDAANKKYVDDSVLLTKGEVSDLYGVLDSAKVTSTGTGPYVGNVAVAVSGKVVTITQTKVAATYCNYCDYCDYCNGSALEDVENRNDGGLGIVPHYRLELNNGILSLVLTYSHCFCDNAGGCCDA